MKRKFKQWWSTVPVALTKHWTLLLLVKWCGKARVFHLWVKCQHITHGRVRVTDLFKKNNCVVLLYVFTFLVPCCGVRCDFRIKTMLGSSLHPCVCRGAGVFFTLFVFVCAKWCPTHILMCFCLVFLRLVYPMPVSLSGLSFFITPSVFSNVYITVWTALLYRML